MPSPAGRAGKTRRAAAPADGSTVGSFVIGVPVVGPTIGIPELNPDPFAPVGIFLTYPFVMATSADAPYHTTQRISRRTMCCWAISARN